MRNFWYLTSIAALYLLSNNIFAQIISQTENLNNKSQRQFLSNDHCKQVNRYFKFENDYQNYQFPSFYLSKKFNVTTTLPELDDISLPQGVSSPVYTNTYSSSSALAVMTGAALLKSHDTEYKYETLCSITFYYEKIPNGCYYGLATTGFRCTFSGTGEENDPYILSLK